MLKVLNELPWETWKVLTTTVPQSILFVPFSIFLVLSLYLTSCQILLSYIFWYHFILLFIIVSENFIGYVIEFIFTYWLCYFNWLFFTSSLLYNEFCSKTWLKVLFFFCNRECSKLNILAILKRKDNYAAFPLRGSRQLF